MKLGAGGSAPALFTLFLIVTMLAFAAAVPARAADLHIFGPTSLKDAMEEADPIFEKETGAKITVEYDASGTQARAIEGGAKPDIYIAAGLDWMDYVESRNLIMSASRTNLFRNRMVLVAPKSDARKLDIVPNFPFKNFIGANKVVIADPAMSPAGEYARTALQRLGAWDAAAASVVTAVNVRTALGMVDKGDAGFGIVYETDANSDANVHVVGIFPSASHPPIVYTIAVLAPSATKAEAIRYVGWMQSKEAGPFFAKQGFTVLAAGAGK